jgi:hypothetical protein
LNKVIKDLVEKPIRLAEFFESAEFEAFIAWFTCSDHDSVSESDVHYFQTCDKKAFKDVVESIWQHQEQQALIERDGYTFSTQWRDLEVMLIVGQGSEFVLSKSIVDSDLKEGE